MVTSHPFPLLVLLLSAAVSGCERSSTPQAPAELPDVPSPLFRNVATRASYVGDAACSSCHMKEAAAYGQHAMAQTFHPWTAGPHVETPLATPLRHLPSGLSYTVTEDRGRLYQVEFLIGDGGRRVHELRRRIDYVMGSGKVAYSYFTEENGRLFQLPLTWYRAYGWDFSPGYQVNSARFGRVMPDRCIACHSSYPTPLPFVEGKYAEVRSGIGCERCHGPGALHVKERTAQVRLAGAYDNSIVNPARLPLQRRLDVCEQCHVHTAVTVQREGKNAFSFMPSQALHDQEAFFKVAGSIDLVSHADRLRQSRCFIATSASPRPLECATCHDSHAPPPDSLSRNQPCQSCHSTTLLHQRLARSASLADHGPTANCVSCHMPRVEARRVLHGSFTDHWIRVATTGSGAGRDTARRTNDGPLEPYYERDRTGPAARVYQGMGEIVYATLANDGRVLSDGAAVLDSALGRDTTRGEARFLLGVAYDQIGLGEQAIHALEQSVRIDSNRPDRLRALAQAYERAGRAPAAIDQLYQRALRVQPALAWIRADHADFLQAQGERDRAIREYQSALAEQPSLSVAWFNLGTVLSDAGRADASAHAFQSAVHLDPSLAQALTPMVQMRTKGKLVTDVKSVGLRPGSLPKRGPVSGGIQLTVAAAAEGPGVIFLDVAAHKTMRILKPDGTPVRALPTGEGGALRWDLLNEAGDPIAGGLYRAQVQGRDAAGRALAPRIQYIGVVRQRS